MDEQLFPVALLLDELKSDDVTLRLNAIHRISTIALALGPERTRDELVPFLQDSLDDEDEVLLALAEELGSFTEYVGGQEYAHVTLSPLESLAGMEETLVRDKACESINNIAAELSTEQVEKYYLPLLQRLTNGDWFTPRTSACALFASVHQTANDNTRQELFTLFKKLTNDETPMVRRSAAKNIAGFVNVLQPEEILSDFIALYKKLAIDDQDSVRLLTVEALIAIMKKLDKAQVNSELLPCVRAACNDASWRVRFMVGQKFVEMAECVNQDIIRDELVQTFVNLLKDNEAEVRTASASQIPGVAKFVDQEIVLAKILPVVREIAGDQSQHVRAAVGNELSGLAPLLGKEETVENLLPIFLQLLKDEFPDVRLNIISRLDKVNDVIGIDYLSKALLPAIFELAEDKQWRVRQAIIEYIPLLAKQLGVEFFNEQLGNLCMSWLGDTVFSIRDAATINLKNLTEVFGSDWASQTVVPKVVAMGNHSNYLYRMTTVFAITTMSPALQPKVIQEQILSIILSLTTDPIPNVRFNVAKCLEVLSSNLQQTPEGQEVIQREILPAVDKLKEDQDADVRFFSNKAIESITGVKN